MKSSITRILAACVLSFAALSAHAQLVRVHTNLGPIDWNLLPSAPVTVANFLAYANAGDYTNVMIHRSAWTNNNTATHTPSTGHFVIQGGGFVWHPDNSLVPLTSRGQIQNEFSVARSNLRGTVAMAKVGGQPNSATSQWFINMIDNTFLDTNNGGFTVFARVTVPGMAVAERIASLNRFLGSSPFGEMPVVNWPGTNVPQRNHAVLVSAVTVFPANPSTADRILNFLEAQFPQHLGSSLGAVTREAQGYQFRYYADKNALVGVKDGKVWYLVPSINENINELATVEDLLAAAQWAGY